MIPKCQENQYCSKLLGLKTKTRPNLVKNWMICLPREKGSSEVVGVKNETSPNHHVVESGCFVLPFFCRRLREKLSKIFVICVSFKI